MGSASQKSFESQTNFAWPNARGRNRPRGVCSTTGTRSRYVAGSTLSSASSRTEPAKASFTQTIHDRVALLARHSSPPRVGGARIALPSVSATVEGSLAAVRQLPSRLPFGRRLGAPEGREDPPLQSPTRMSQPAGTYGATFTTGKARVVRRRMSETMVVLCAHLSAAICRRATDDTEPGRRRAGVQGCPQTALERRLALATEPGCSLPSHPRRTTPAGSQPRLQLMGSVCRCGVLIGAKQVVSAASRAASVPRNAGHIAGSRMRT